MNSFLLVTEIHAFKVLPSPHTFALISAWTGWERLRRSDMGPLDSPSKVTCSMCKSHELIPSSYWDSCNQVLPRIYLDLEKNGWKWRFFAWLRVKWRSYGIPRLTFISSIQWWKPHHFIPSSHFNPGSMRFGACMHKRWEKWLKWRPFRWRGVKWRSYGVPMVYND